MSDDILSTVYLILILALILPGFIYANKNKKTFLKNLLLWSTIWIVIVLVLSLV
jgi:hypothetical protein